MKTENCSDGTPHFHKNRNNISDRNFSGKFSDTLHTFRFSFFSLFLWFLQREILSFILFRETDSIRFHLTELRCKDGDLILFWFQRVSKMGGYARPHTFMFLMGKIFLVNAFNQCRSLWICIFLFECVCVLCRKVLFLVAVQMIRISFKSVIRMKRRRARVCMEFFKFSVLFFF